MKMKRLLSIILAVITVFCAFPVMNVSAEDTERAVVDSGFCGAQGDNLTWTFYEDGELVISGEGETPFYYITEQSVAASSPLVPPWYDYFEDIRVITVEEGVTGIGDDAFGFYPRNYYRVNLPKSLEYYYLGSFVAAHPDKITLACCYAGTEAEWNKVEKKSWHSLRPDIATGEIISISYNQSSYGWGISDNATDDMYYNGKEPEIYCQIIVHDDALMYSSQLKKGQTGEVHVRYYPGENTDAKLVWKAEGDGCTMEHTKYSDSGVPTHTQITSVTHGEYSLIAEIVAPDGTVLSSDEEEFFSYVREDMTFREKAEEFFSGIISFFSYYLYMFNLIGMLFGMSFTG